MTGDAQHTRAVELLAGSAAALRRLAPDDAAAMAAAAAALQSIVASPASRRLLSPAAKRAAADEVRAWMLRRLESWPLDRPPPSQVEDIEAAKRDLPDIPRNYIIIARPPEWPLTEGRPRTRR
jgi:hypothetical protein